MILPGDRYSFTKKGGYNSSKRSIKKIVLFLLILILIGIAIYAFVSFKSTNNDNNQNVEKNASFHDLLNNKRYEELNIFCETVLEKNPLNLLALTFNGFSYFYRGASKFTLEDQIPFFEKSIINLRKAELSKNNPYKSEIKYILGKAYYHKGKYYLDLAIAYMLESIELEYIKEDTYEYLGIAYKELGLYEESLNYFTKALEYNTADTLLIIVGQIYFSLKDYKLAEEYLLRALNKSEDIIILQKGLFLLGEIYYSNSNFLKAEMQYKKVLEINPRSADAHYHLGEVYSKLNDNIKARAQWRKALKIEPTHHGALIQLYK